MNVKTDLNFKIAFDLKMTKNSDREKKRVITKILKLDENNQYGH